MIHRTPQRTYTPQTIELWFDRLNRDWEGYFSKEELNWGRQYYRTGEIRSTELLESSAIVHFKRGKEPLYVIVDWEGDQPSFRQSHPGLAPGHGLAVAGMYELEEFIADELPPVQDGSLKEGAGSGQHDEPEPIDTTPTERTGRELRVRLQPRSDGLWMEAGWQASGRKTDWSHFCMRDLTRWEREQLIGYTARAHKVGFRPGDREGTYRMPDCQAILHFFEEELAGWKERYVLEEDSLLKSWKSGLKRVHPRVEVREAGLSGAFRFDFTHRGHAVSEDLRQRLFQMPGHVHFVPGQGIYQVDPESLGSVHEWKSLLPSEGEGVLPRYLLFTFSRDPLVEIRLSDEMSGWRRRVESGEADAAGLELPDYLRSYQREGVAWLRKLESAGCPGLLADEMGLGKTIQVLSYLDSRRALGQAAVLVVCPASVVPVWLSEIRRFYPDTPAKVLSRTQTFDKDTTALWLASYTQLRRNKHLLEGIEFDYAILDEAQSIKNPDAKVTHACLAIRSRHRIALTGTPVENRPLDMWTLFRFLMPGFLGSRRHFEDLLRTEPAFVARLRQQIRPFILRRTKDAVAADLPAKVEIDWICPLTPAQRSAYQELAAGAVEQFGGRFQEVLREKRIHLFSLLTRLRQACCDPALLPGYHSRANHSGKLESLVKRLEEAFDGGSKVVVFSQFVQFLRRAKKVVGEAFPEIPQIELTGATIDRERPVQRFRETEGAAVFFISLRAGGTGLNLQAADYVFLLDPWWNPAVEAQAIDRVHRIGQKRRVIVYRMVTRGTIEERIDRLKKDKGQLFQDLLSDLEAPVDIFKQFESLQDLVALEGESEGTD